jgi:hypothetical protein
LSSLPAWHGTCSTHVPYTHGIGPAHEIEEVVAVDDEAVGLRHEVTGSDAVTCDLCGRPVALDDLSDLAVDRGMGEPVEAVRACPSCHRAAGADDLPYDAEIAAGLRDADD